jgi:hypothetical protein
MKLFPPYKSSNWAYLWRWTSLRPYKLTNWGYSHPANHRFHQISRVEPPPIVQISPVLTVAVPTIQTPPILAVKSSRQKGLPTYYREAFKQYMGRREACSNREGEKNTGALHWWEYVASYGCYTPSQTSGVLELSIQTQGWAVLL